MSPEPIIAIPRRAAWILAGLFLLAGARDAPARVWQLVPGGGDASAIQIAVEFAADGDTIDLAPGFYSEATSVVNKTLLIRGAGLDVTTLSLGGHGHTVALRGANNFTELRDLTIQDGSANSRGDLLGGIYGGGVLGEEAYFALIRCRIASNSCESLGGGIYATAVSFDHESGNSPRRGPRSPGHRPVPRPGTNPLGIIRDHVLLSECLIESNFGGSEGGGICMELAFFRIVDCVIRGNFAGQGGGVALINSVGEMTGCLIDNNEALLDGGGVKLDTGLAMPPPTVRVSQCTIVRNRCDRYGSGVALTSGETIEIRSNLFDGQTGSAFSVIGCANAAVYAGGCNHFGVNASPPVDGCPLIATDTTGPPLFCNSPVGDWRLCSNSPALQTSPGCNLYRGAFFVGCTGNDCATAVLPTTWSAIKSLAR
ncbi:MAG: right-handed parallel beta-helix repeat-containing protein [Candidatus Eisenbacteria bacterium]|nr:right-handed parallel beta-helix repeat-containing protein [Candidatus Eisenbacteria bacterium]